MAAIRFFDEVLIDEAYSSRRFFSNTGIALKKVFQSLIHLKHNHIIDKRINRLLQSAPEKSWSETHLAEKVHLVYSNVARENAIRRMMKLKY